MSESEVRGIENAFRDKDYSQLRILKIRYRNLEWTDNGEATVRRSIEELISKAERAWWSDDGYPRKNSVLRYCIDIRVYYNAGLGYYLQALLGYGLTNECDGYVFSDLKNAIKEGIPPEYMHYASGALNGCNKGRLLRIGCKYSDVKIVEFMLDMGARVNDQEAGDDKISPLHIACKNGNSKIVEILIKSGADVNIKRNSYATPLYDIVNRSYYGKDGIKVVGDETLKCVRLLVENGADLNLAGYRKSTPKEIADILLEKDPNLVAKGCYIATCVYGSYDCPQVWTLRRYRDDTLGSTWYGRMFIRTYYAISPTLVKWFGHTKWFKKMWKGKLDRMVAKLNATGVEATVYQDKIW